MLTVCVASATGYDIEKIIFLLLPPEPGEKRVKPRKRRMEPVFYEALCKRKNQEREMKTVIRDLVIYFIYMSIVYIISYGNRDPNAFLSKQAIESAIIFGGVNCDILPTDDPRFKKCQADQVCFTNKQIMIWIPSIPDVFFLFSLLL